MCLRILGREIEAVKIARWRGCHRAHYLLSPYPYAETTILSISSFHRLTQSAITYFSLSRCQCILERPPYLLIQSLHRQYPLINNAQILIPLRTESITANTLTLTSSSLTSFTSSSTKSLTLSSTRSILSITK
jgi:hypothetical protein